MIERQIAARGIDDQRVLDAFRSVPRELFVPPEMAARAYDDGPLPIGGGQTISQPYIVALMLAAAGIEPEDRVLEVGAGSGYAAALLGHLAKEVIAIERLPSLAADARERIERLGLGNVTIVAGDGSHGWPDRAPFDAILVAATAPSVPQALIDQLGADGRLVLPVGSPFAGENLVRIERDGDGFRQQVLGSVRFVPLISD